ncbi:MAG TPA: class I SAM-dependent methyltransferase [Myxococcales bacterium]|nr:class I SAM-dependent methyltransferase [Myxococcales bacterium]
MPFSDALLACPRCGGKLRELRCAACRAQYHARGGIPDLRVPSDARTEAVREFYLRAPFPNYPPRDSLSALRARAGRSAFARRLDRSLPGDAVIAEIGCGTGQLSLFLASADRVVVGADLSRASLELASAAAGRYGVSAQFVETDLRSPGLRRGAFDVVICSGVLHHTPDPRASFAAVASLARPGGVLVIGLYNAFARIPQRLRRAAYRLCGVAPLDPVLASRSAEPARREAWLRDQYLHPEEHRHTLREVRGWFAENGVEYLRCFPSALFGGEDGDLFTQSEDEWAPESLLSQLSWMRTLGGEGGLFVVTGSVAAS